MKKIAIGLGVLIGLLVLLKTTGALVNYTLPTTSNEPTLKLNTHFFATNLKSPEKGDFITFVPPVENNGEIYVKRLCAVENDTIEMINGCFYVNGKNADTGLTLQHAHIVSDEVYARINKKYPITDFVNINQNLYEIQISDQVASEFKILDKKSIQRVPGQGEPILTEFDASRSWTRDNFGPLVVPANQVFVLGDNRHYSYDSRYFGFVDTDNIKGAVLWK